MVIKGLQKTSLIDYPGYICATAFAFGCNFRCPYCHNPELVNGGAELPDIPIPELMDFLRRRRDLLDGLTVTGGEPLIHAGLPEFLAGVKALGLRVKLDTNGSNPFLLQRLLSEGLVDFIALDVKSSPSRYSEAIGVPAPLSNIEKSLRLTLESGCEYELRCTILPRLHDERTLRELGEFVRGAETLCLQRFRSVKVLDPSYADEPSFTEDEMSRFAELLGEYVGCCRVR